MTNFDHSNDDARAQAPADPWRDTAPTSPTTAARTSPTTPATAKTVVQPANQDPAKATPAGPQVVYLVSGQAGDIGSVQYTDQDGDIIRRGGVKLPWRLTFTVTGQKKPLVLVSQRKQGGTGPVTCSITFDGKVLSSTTQTGRYAAPECSG